MKTESRLASKLVQIGFLAALLLTWHLFTVSGDISPLLLPPLMGVIEHFIDLLKDGDYLQVTVTEVAIAFSAASVLGCTVGYLVSRSGFMIRTFDPLFAGLYAIPAILVYPLYVLFFGLGPESKIAIGLTIAFFPVVLNTIAGFGNVDRVFITAAQSMGASDFQMFRRVLLPAAFPVILTGLRMGFILSFLSILGAETITSISGLGHRIVELAELMDTAEMFAFIIFVVIIAIALNALVTYVERRGRHY